MPRNTQSNRGNRGQSKNNNPEGYNQYNSGWMDTARDRPVAAAAAAAAAVGASVFLWSRRSQISNQISNLSDQIGEWSESMNSRGGSEEFEMAGGESSFEGSSASGSAGGASSGSQFSGGNSAGSFAGSTNPSPGNKRGSGGGGKSGQTPS
ncbi:MAG TPA: hypothetical protein VGB39_05840 [Sphingomicrobium sp.]